MPCGRGRWSRSMPDELCVACGAAMPPDFKFCENCGHERGAPLAAAAATVAPARSLTSVDPATDCPACGAEEASDGFCDSCGQRRPSGKNHTELDLGAVAGVTDIGHRHHVNEDAIAIAVGDGAVIGIVCDGVSSSSRADTASHAAVSAAMSAMLDALGDGADPETAMEAGGRSAQAAAALVGGSMPGPNPPSCTFVCAIATAE